MNHTDYTFFPIKCHRVKVSIGHLHTYIMVNEPANPFVNQPPWNQTRIKREAIRYVKRQLKAEIV